MTINLVNIGSAPDDGTGDTLRDAYEIINDNFADASNAASRLVATTAQAQSGTGTQVPDVSGVYSLIADLGLGRSDPKLLGSGSIADLKTAGIYIQTTAAQGTVANGYPVNSFYGLIEVRRVGYYGANDPRVVRTAFNFATRRKYFQVSLAGGSFEDWKEDLTTGNTTVDANGFIKQASPIISLFSDRIESNDSLEVANAEFERVDVGHYVIRNVPLLSRAGWYIETPKDRNGNVYFTIDYDESIEGELTIRTYEPDYSTGRATNGNPVDILEGRFVSLRFEEIPELYPTPDEGIGDEITSTGNDI